MIGFGELRKRSLQWGLDISAVERSYATDWLLKGIFDDGRLASSLALRGSSALRYAYAGGKSPAVPENAPDGAAYALAEPPEFLVIRPVATDMPAVLREASQAAAMSSGCKFSLITFERGIARFQYMGPLGRRSAAQPLIVVSLIAGQPRLTPVSRPLVHPFSDLCAASVYAVSPEELAAERIATLTQRPRARDVFDLWFALTQISGQMDWTRTRELAAGLAHEKHIALPRPDTLFQPDHRSALERSWDAALRTIPHHVSFAALEKDLSNALQSLVVPGDDR